MLLKQRPAPDKEQETSEQKAAAPAAPAKLKQKRRTTTIFPHSGKPFSSTGRILFHVQFSPSALLDGSSSPRLQSFGTFSSYVVQKRFPPSVSLIFLESMMKALQQGTVHVS